MSEESEESEDEQEQSRGFRVTDRRRFSSESGEPPPDTAQSDHPQETASSPPVEITFSSFILGLSTQALMYLGEIPAAADQIVPTDLSAAQQMIDVIAILQKRTVGNLDAGEAQMLESVLFDLRMRYVELKKKERSS